MMRTETFEYDGEPVYAIFSNYKVGRRTVTTCDLAVRTEAGIVQIESGATICAPDDRYDPELGEVKALSAALKETPRDVREQLQDQLSLSHIGGPAARRLLEEPGYGARGLNPTTHSGLTNWHSLCYAYLVNFVVNLRKPHNA
jgi:hypothetical protein